MKAVKWIVKVCAIIMTSVLVLLIAFFLLFPTVYGRLAIAMGSQMTWFGHNEMGNTLGKHGLSKIENKRRGDYHAYSVQNTKNGNYSEAITALEKAYALDEAEGAYYGWLLLYYYHDYEKALKVLDKFDQTTPNFADAPVGENIHYLKGLANMQLGRFDKAIELFDQCIKETDSTFGEGWVNIYTYIEKGRCKEKLGFSEEAIATYRKAIEEYPQCTEAYYYSGISYLTLENTDSAKTNFLKAKSLVDKGYKSSEVYVETFHEVYKQDIEKQLKLLGVN